MSIDFINDLADQGNNIKKQSVKNNNNKTSSASIFLSGDAYTRHMNSDGFTPLFASKNLNQCNFQKTVKNRHDILADSKNSIITKPGFPRWCCVFLTAAVKYDIKINAVLTI